VRAWSRRRRDPFCLHLGVVAQSLDGDWRVERLSGFLPPLPIRKRIDGRSGMTRIGPLRLRFRVVGTTLCYRPPFRAFVDTLEPSGDGFVGRATVFGREYARFRLVPA
jgi:hypothetical protein